VILLHQPVFKGLVEQGFLYISGLMVGGTLVTGMVIFYLVGSALS